MNNWSDRNSLKLKYMVIRFEAAMPTMSGNHIIVHINTDLCIDRTNLTATYVEVADMTHSIHCKGSGSDFFIVIFFVVDLVHFT